MQTSIERRDPSNGIRHPGDDLAAINEQKHEAGASDEKQGQIEQQGKADGSQIELVSFSGQGDQSQQSVYGQAFGQAFGLDSNQQNLTGMDWSNTSNFNMMQMQMQNAMQNGNWNAFPNMMGKNCKSRRLRLI